MFGIQESTVMSSVVFHQRFVNHVLNCFHGALHNHYVKALLITVSVWHLCSKHFSIIGVFITYAGCASIILIAQDRVVLPLLPCNQFLYESCYWLTQSWDVFMLWTILLMSHVQVFVKTVWPLLFDHSLFDVCHRSFEHFETSSVNYFNSGVTIMKAKWRRIWRKSKNIIICDNLLYNVTS